MELMKKVDEFLFKTYINSNNTYVYKYIYLGNTWNYSPYYKVCYLERSRPMRSNGKMFPFDDVIMESRSLNWNQTQSHYDVIKWKPFPRYWPFVRGMRSPVNSPDKGQWRGALMFSLICALINGWVNNREAGDLRRHRPHYDITAMFQNKPMNLQTSNPFTAWRKCYHQL